VNDLKELLEKLKIALAEMDEDDALDDIYEVEGVLLISQDMNDKIEFYKNLKKKRNQDIDSTINQLDKKQIRLRSIIFNTMKKHSNKKTLNFPSVGKVSIKKTRRNWEVVDEKQLLDFLEQNGSTEGVTESQVKIKKKELKEKLEYYKSQEIEVPGVEEIEVKESLAVQFEKNINSVDVDSVSEERSVGIPSQSGIEELQELVDL